MEDITDKIVSDKYCYSDRVAEFVEMARKETLKKLKKRKKKQLIKSRKLESDSQFGDESSDKEESFYFCKGDPPEVVMKKQSLLRKQRAKKQARGNEFYAKKVLFPKVRKQKLDDVLAMKYRYEKVGDTDSDLGTEWENYINYLWKSYEEKEPEEWRKQVHREAQYIDEEYISTDGGVTTYRQLQRKQDRVNRRKKRRIRDPDFDNTKRNTCWKCEWPKGDSSNTESFYKIPSIVLSATSGSEKEGIPKRNLENKVVIQRSEELVERLTNYGGVTNVLIAIEEKVAATNIKDRELVSYLMEHFHPLLIMEWRIMKDFDQEDTLLTIIFETTNFDLICGVGYGGTKRESFAIMLYQILDKEFASIDPIEGSIEKPTMVDFPKVWLKGLEKRPESPPSIHMRKFREATGLKPLKEKPYKDFSNVQPMLRTGLHNTYAEWREAAGTVEGQQMDEKLYKPQKKEIKFIEPISSGSEADRKAKRVQQRYGQRREEKVTMPKVEFTGSGDSKDEDTD